MFTLQQVIKATAAANASVGGGATDHLYKFLRAATRGVTSSAEATTTTTATNTAITQTQTHTQLQEPKQSSQASSEFNFSDGVSHNSPAKAHGCCRSESESKSESAHDVNPTTATSAKQFVRNLLVQHSQDLQQQPQQQRFIHSKCSSQDSAKSSQQQQQTTKFAMSSLAAEPLQAEISSADGVNTVGTAGTEGSNATSGAACHEAASSAGKKPCFNTGLADILQFMELIGNLKVSTDTDWSRNSLKELVSSLLQFASIFPSSPG